MKEITDCIVAVASIAASVVMIWLINRDDK